jgi:protein-disulfide isomerase
MNKTFWAIIAVIILIFGAILLFKGGKANAPSSNGAKPTSHVMGEGKAKIVLVEYGDYQCPYCGSYYQPVKDTVTKYNDQITFQFRNLPLLQVHKNAFVAARAAEAASAQGKFWEMHDLLYANQTVWSDASNPNPIFEQFATQLGLKIEQFKKDAASVKVNDTINADIAAFMKTGLQESTPTFLLDGKKITPSNSVEDFSKIIDAAIAAKQKN